MKIYLASSWRNEKYPSVLQTLRKSFEVFDFRNNDTAFHWSDIDPNWQSWKPTEFRHYLWRHPLAAVGFNSDWDGMRWADACVLLLPCGRSAHLEAGYFVGQGKPLVIYISDGEPELMYRMANSVVTNDAELLLELKRIEVHPGLAYQYGDYA